MSKCPCCGCDLRPGARFCLQCGTQAVAQAPGVPAVTPDLAHGVCAAGHPQVRPNARYCYACGQPVLLPDPANGVCQCGHPQVRPGARFCYIDGSPVSRPHPAHGICARGHPQIRPGARFCYRCGAPVPRPGSGPTFNGRYVTIGEVGRGGMGSIIYKVQDVQSPGRVLALKEMDETQLVPPIATPKEIPEIVKAFQREADLLQRFDHANVVKAYDYFQIGCKHYMALDLIRGRTLEEILETSPGGFPESRVLAWAEQICDAMGYLHDQTPPIIYRDMKPSNVMIEDGSDQIKMIDFGIARQYKGGKKRGDTIKFGTAGYAAPEAASNKETSPASDVYSLGTMLYQLLTGEDPTDNPLGFFRKASLVRPPVSASQRVVDAVERAVELEIAKRFQSMAEFREALTGRAAPALPARQSGQGAAVTPLPVPSYSPPIPIPQQAPSALRVSRTRLDMGQVERGGILPSRESFSVSLSGGGTAQVSAKEAWLTVSPSSVTHRGHISVSIQSEQLPLGTVHWHAPSFLAPFARRTWEVLRKAWWAAMIVLCLGFAWPWIWLGLVAIPVGTVVVQITMWWVSWLLGHVVVKAADCKGQIVVSQGADRSTVKAEVRAVPSTWRNVVGWGTLIVATAAELGAIGGALWWLIDGLGGWL